MGSVVYPELRLRFLREMHGVPDVVLRPRDLITVGKDVSKLNLEEHLQRSPLTFVSRQHLIIGCDDDGWFIQDSSLNGTWLKNFKLQRGRRFPLQHGHIVVLPDPLQSVEIRVEMEGTQPLLAANDRLCHYHQQELQYILSCLERLKCVHLVGPCGIGKGMILHELLQWDVQQCATIVPPLLFCDIDLRRLSGHEIADFYILVANNLGVAASPLGARFSSLPLLIDNCCEAMQKITHDAGYYPLLVRMLREIGEVAAYRVVFIMRHFEISLNALSPTILADLQALYRDNIWHPLFVCASNDSVVQVTCGENSLEISGLAEVFSSERWLRPLGRDDLRQYLQIHTGNPSFAQTQLHLIYELSGGWPSIARAAVDELSKLSEEQYTTTTLALLDQLARADSVSTVCLALLSDLSEAERELLVRLTLHAASSTEQELAGKAMLVERLINKGLLRRNPSGALEMQASLLERVFQTNHTVLGNIAPTPGSIDGARGVAMINGRALKAGSDLTTLEYRLLAYLLQRPNEMVTYDELLSNVYEDVDHNIGGTSRVQRLIGRLRDKVETDPKHPTIIVNVRGVGIRLIQ